MSSNPTRDKLLLKVELEKNKKADRTTSAIAKIAQKYNSYYVYADGLHSDAYLIPDFVVRKIIKNIPLDVNIRYT